MNFEIYAYWNTVELAGVFNAIAALTGGSDFKGLLKTLSLVAVLAVVLAALGGKGKAEDFWRWVILLGIFNGMLLVPKATVQIVDRTGAAPTMVVANVPLGLASLAHGTSKIGDWLTTSYETVFSLPDEVQLRKNGTLFGHRVARERLLMTTTNPLITHNLVEFYRECVLPSIATGNFSAKDIFESSDIWTTLAAVNPGLMVQLVNPSTGVPYDPESCGDAYTKQTPHLTAEAENVAKEKGAAYYPNVSSALATTTFKNSLASTTSYLLNVSKTAPDLIKQAMVGNAIIDAGYKVAAQMGDPSTAQVKLAEAQSLRAFNVSYSTQANLATETMPKLRNVIEIVTYAMFPIVALLIIISGPHGLTLLKSYVSALLWVQLWAPLYAVMNYIINVKAASGMSMGTAGNGLALKYYNYVGSSVASDEAITGVLVIAIPALAWGIVKGTMDAASAIKSAVGGGGGTYASNASQGNITMGNSSLNTSKADMDTWGQVNTRASWKGGAGSSAMMNNQGIETITTGGHTSYADAQASNSAFAQLKMNETTARSAQEMSSESLASAYKNTFDFVNAASASQTLSSAWGTGKSGQHAIASENLLKKTQGYAKDAGLDDSQMVQIAAHVRSGMGAPGALKLVTGLSAEAGIEGSGNTTSKANVALKAVNNMANDSSYKDAWNTTLSGLEEKKFAAGNESAQRAGKAVSADLARSNAYQKVASSLRSNAFSLDRNALDDYIKFVQTDAGKSGVAISGDQIVADLRDPNNKVSQTRMEKFSTDMAAKLASDMPEVKGKSDVQQGFENDKKQVLAQREIEGLNPDKKVDGSQVIKESGDLIRQAGSEVEKQDKKLGSNWDVFKAKIDSALTNPNLTGRAFAGAASSALSHIISPAAVKLIDETLKDHDMRPNSPQWQAAADNYNGDSPWTDVGIGAGSFLAGGVLGSVAGRVSGKLVANFAESKMGAAAVEKFAEVTSKSNNLRASALESTIALDARSTAINSTAKAEGRALTPVEAKSIKQLESAKKDIDVATRSELKALDKENIDFRDKQWDSFIKKSDPKEWGNAGGAVGLLTAAIPPKEGWTASGSGAGREAPAAPVEAKPAVGSSNQGADRQPVNQGADRQPINQGADRQPINQGADRQPVNEGADRQPINQGADRQPVVSPSGAGREAAAAPVEAKPLAGGVNPTTAKTPQF